jgi:hypothetical protein
LKKCTWVIGVVWGVLAALVLCIACALTGCKGRASSVALRTPLLRLEDGCVDRTGKKVALPSANGGIAILSLADDGSISGAREIAFPAELGQVIGCVWSASGRAVAVDTVGELSSKATSCSPYAVVDLATGRVLMRSPGDLLIKTPGPPAPDGQKGVFTALDRDMQQGAYVIDSHQGLTRLSSGPVRSEARFAMAAWSNDSQQVYYLASQGLWRAQTDGTGKHLVARLDNLLSLLDVPVDPDWYACRLRPWPKDGQLGFRLVDSIMKAETGRIHALVGKVDLNTGTVTTIWAGTGWADVTVSPDEKRAAALKDLTTEGAGLRLIDLATRRETTIAKGGVQGVAWVLGGSRLLFAKNKSELWVVDPATRRLSRIWPKR